MRYDDAATPRSFLLVAFIFLTTLIAIPARAQDAEMPQHPHAAEPEPPTWTWTTDANVFFSYNYQHRLFRDFSVWESQNWFMLAGQRPLASGTVSLEGMISLEPFTLKAIGSPQVFQTG
ncbi:MAG: hypothetical protein DMF91_26285, partial [Acidobacteria bacterium]